MEPLVTQQLQTSSKSHAFDGELHYVEYYKHNYIENYNYYKEYQIILCTTC